MIKPLSFVSALLCASALTAPAAFAEPLEVRLAAEISSMDPHYQSQSPNAAMSRNMFDPLVMQDANQVLQPGLATSWEAIDDTTWEFRLREGVTFHDGSPFTAEDVAFTIRRIPELDSPGSLERYVRQITDIEIVDPLTIRLKTEGPFPLMPVFMSGFVIVNEETTTDASTDDFNAGTAVIGTGPYRFESWVPGDRVSLVRNDAYWGGAPAFEEVEIQFVSEDSARVTQLLTGEADFIDQIPPQLAERVEGADGIEMSMIPSYRFIYLGINFASAGNTQYVTDAAGKPLAESPLLDQRVRLAISKAIDRTAIAERIMGGFAQPASQINLEAAGASPNQPAPGELYDPEGAKELLAEAGYPDGFVLNFISPNDSYINDAQVAQAITQMLARVGIEVQLEALPASVMFSRMNEQAFGIYMYGHGATTGEPTGSVSNLLGTFDRELGQGSSNRGRYSNPELDRLLAEAATTLDDEARAALAVEAIDLAMGDVAIVPIQHQFYVTAMKEELNFIPRVDERFFAANVGID